IPCVDRARSGSATRRRGSSPTSPHGHFSPRRIGGFSWPSMASQKRGPVRMDSRWTGSLRETEERRLHRALLRLTVGIVREDLLLCRGHVFAVPAPDRLNQMEILDRKLVRVVAEAPARRGEVGSAQGLAQGILVRNLGTGCRNRRIDQEAGIVCLRGEVRRHIAVL